MPFGVATPTVPWPIDVVTLDYVFSGSVELADQKWGWNYFQVYGQRPAQTLDLRVAECRSTAGLPAPGWVGTKASFTFHGGLVAVIPRGDAAVAVWEEWNGTSTGVPAVVLVGPYAVSGTVLSPDSTMGPPLLNHAFPVRDATITRCDGRGDPTPIAAPRAIVGTAFVQAAAVAGPAPG